MRSDISYTEKHREEYRLLNADQMVESQIIVYSNGFVNLGEGCNEGKILSPYIWEKRMFLKDMNAVLITTKSGHRTWGWSRYGECVKPYSDFLKKWRYKMNELIIEMFPVTKEAVLVDKWFGREINNPIFKMLIKGKEKELIEEATRLENKSNDKGK